MAYYNTVSVGTGANLILSDNTKRLSLILVNEGPSTAYIGQDASVTTLNGVPILANGTFCEDSGGTKMYCGPFYAVCGSASTIAYWERVR